MIDPVWTTIEGELEFRANASGPMCVIRIEEVSSPTAHGEVRLEEEMYSLIERTIPMAYGSELLCRHPATLLFDGRFAAELFRVESLDSSKVIALEALDEEDRFSTSYFLSQRGELRTLSAIRQEHIADALSDQGAEPRECSVGGILVASKDRCQLTVKYTNEPGQQAALLDHTLWFPVLKQQIPADRQPAWPILVLPTVVRGMLATHSLPPFWQFTEVTSITVQLLKCLQRISTHKNRPRWIYQDLI